jgi:hypothetical protein
MIADPNSELLKQLTRIADAMSKTGISAWLDWIKTLAAFILGIITAYLSLLLQGRASDRREQSKMRRIVYSELAQCFVLLDSMVRNTPPGRGARYEMRQDLCAFDGESYMKENRVVFYELPEGAVLTWIYYQFHSVRAGGTYGLVEMKGPLGFFSEKFKEYPALKSNFRRFAQAGDFRIIQEAVKLYKWSATIEEMVDSGMLVVVPKSAPDARAELSKNTDGETKRD